jgi:CHASE1-domain containing sensor protein
MIGEARRIARIVPLLLAGGVLLVTLKVEG